MLVYRGVDVGDARGLFAANGWGGSWVNGVFDFHHFHSTSHEVLAVIAGSATIELGGPQGEAFDVARRRRAGAAGGHRAPPGERRRGLHASSARTRAGQEDYDVLREADEAALARIAALGPPPTDPVGGEGVALWRGTLTDQQRRVDRRPAQPIPFRLRASHRK